MSQKISQRETEPISLKYTVISGLSPKSNHLHKFLWVMTRINQLYENNDYRCFNLMLDKVVNQYAENYVLGKGLVPVHFGLSPSLDHPSNLYLHSEDRIKIGFPEKRKNKNLPDLSTVLVAHGETVEEKAQTLINRHGGKNTEQLIEKLSSLSYLNEDYGLRQKETMEFFLRNLPLLQKPRTF